MSETLAPVVEALEGAGFEPLLVGALAAWAWGHPRTTGDLDLVVLAAASDEGRVRDALQALGWPVHGPERDDFGRRFRVDAPLLPVEVFLAPPMEVQRREHARAVPVELAGRSYRVLSKEDFVLRKLVNLRVRSDSSDKTDILMAIARNWEGFDFAYVRRHCAVQRVCGAFEAFVQEAEAQRGREGARAT